MTKFTFAPLVLSSCLIAGCSTPEAPDVTNNVTSALEARGLNDVDVAQDRTSGVVTLTGNVATEADKAAAAAAAQSAAAGQVVANQIVVTPRGLEDEAEDINAALDDAIDNNLKALMIQRGSPADVSYSVKSAVVTLTGSVTSQAARGDLEKAVAAVPNVKQVVNELQVENQRATTTR
jgi:osmotically-inducible protein OsmY